MAGPGLSNWFEDNPIALKTVLRYRESGKSWRVIVDTLQASGHKFPFSSDTALMRFINGPKGKTAKAVAAAPKFTRTQRDLKKLASGETFFVTSAVNNCEADDDFLGAVETWRKYTGGKVLVNPVLYVNPTRTRHAQKGSRDIWWDPRLRDWMLDQEIRPHAKLSIMTTKAQATSNDPVPPRALTLSQDRSAVFGHPQLSMRTVATPQNQFPKILYSSGAITKKNYSDTVTGDVAEFHHSLGGIIVEVRGDKFHLREVVWDGSQFIDIDTSFDAKGAYYAPEAEALVMGDIHVGLHSPDVMEATFGEGGLLEATQAKKLILHDVFNGHSVSPHEQGLLTRAAMWNQGENNLTAELHGVRRWLEEFPGQKEGVDTYIVASNHDDFLKRWLEKGERFVDPENRLMYHELSAEMIRGYDPKELRFPSAVELGLRRIGYEGDARFLKMDESLRLHGVELGMHGHKGPNGSRGSAKGLSKVGTRSIIGHSHTSMIWQGVYQVGHSSQNHHGYNEGPSSWLTSHALLLANGRRQMIHLIGRDYRG